jgi:hypothetical protein
MEQKNIDHKMALNCNGGQAKGQQIERNTKKSG